MCGGGRDEEGTRGGEVNGRKAAAVTEVVRKGSVRYGGQRDRGSDGGISVRSGRCC